MISNYPLPKFAVLLAAYNGEKFINQQISSILSQENIDLHIYVSIDQSIDGTEICIQKLMDLDPRITLLPTGERYGGAAKNFYRLIRDVDLSSYEFISLSDQDDVWFPQKLSRAYAVLSQGNLNAYSSNVIAFWPDGHKTFVKKSYPQVKWDFLFEAAGPGCTYVISKPLILDFQRLICAKWHEVQNIGLHDWFIYAFARANSYKWIIDETPGMFYRQHENNEVGVNRGIKAIQYRAQKIFTGWAFSQSLLIADLVGFKRGLSEHLYLESSRFSYLKLAFFSMQCRRRLRDQFFFAISCLIMCAVAGKGK